MVLTDIAAALAGVIVGSLALLLFWYFLSGLLEERVRQVTFTSFLGLVLGTTIASGPIGSRITGEQLWPWYLVGEAIVVIPGAAFGPTGISGN